MTASLLARYTFFAVFAVFCNAKAPATVDLGGQWTAKETLNTFEFPATVPGGVYSDLMNASILDDVFYGYNSEKYQWVGHVNWTYHRTFEVDESVLAYDNVNLVFEGVDTFAEIILNNVSVGNTQNMFLKYVYDVKSLLKVGNNTIYLKFQSPVEKGKILNDIQLQKYRIPWECPDPAYRGECHINMLRKMQASFSWDWGPTFASVGIWKPVYLEAYDDTKIEYIMANVIEKDADNWNVSVDVYLAANNKDSVVNGLVELNLFLDELIALVRVESLTNLKPNEYGEVVVHTSLKVRKDDVKLWWPNGYGEPNLYNLTAFFGPKYSPRSGGSKTVRIGFRTVELVEKELSNGLSFFFKINDIPIFMKGVNAIPINILPELGQDETAIRRLLQSAKDVHMNMLRVWGGGVYESDVYYDVADELGILVWQDFAFACSLYPVHEEFLENVVQEVRHNVKRIYSHPSVIVYSGNNENEGVLANNWYGTQENYTLYKKDYVKLYIDTVKTELDRLSHTRAIFITSSPSNGKESATEGYVAQNPGSSFYGDVHFYNYAADPWNSNYYPIPRFSSEYGYQSLPSIETWLTATNDTKDLSITSEFLDHRQHHPQGNTEMKLLIDMNLLLPSSNATNYDAAFIFYSQIYAAQAIKVETEHYRRYRSILDEQGQGYTMGALYWQLNDVWVAPSWSSIDYTGRWKMLHYFAKDFFAPIIITGHINSERNLQIYSVSDELQPHDAARVLIKVYKYNDSTFTPVSVQIQPTNLLPSYSHLEATIMTDVDLALSNSCGNSSEASLNCFYYLQMTDGNGQSLAPDNYVFPAPLVSSNVPLTNVKVSNVTLISAEEQLYSITVTSDNIALFVWLDSHTIRGTFSENGFLMVSPRKTVQFRSETPAMTADSLSKVLTVTNLRDPQYFV